MAAPTDFAYCSAETKFGLTCFSRLPPPTEKTSTQSAAPRRLTRSHASNTVAQPSSLVRAVNSETLSVGQYASMPQILRKSLTACDAFAALPPTPRMNNRPPRARAPASNCANFSMACGSRRRRTSADSAMYSSTKLTQVIRKLANALSRTDLVESLADLAGSQLAAPQQVAIGLRKIGVWRAFESRAAENAQAIIDVLHARGPVLFIIGQDAAFAEFHVAGVPTALVSVYGHQSRLASRAKSLLHIAVRAGQVRVAIQHEARAAEQW